MISVRRYASLMWVTGLFAGGLATVLLPRAARAQTYEGDVPPPPDEYEAQPEDVPADALPPPQAPDQNTFQRALSPYGRWVDTVDYGRVWVPYETDSDWQPYTDGRWVDTQWGWSFAPAVPWGWAAFHYGRWGFGVGLGWFWVPGFVWSPAWVSWRYSAGFFCWSPFAPAGFAFGRHWPGWVVVPGSHFTHPINRFRVARIHSVGIVRAANPVVGISSRAATGRFRGGWGTPNARSRGNARPGANVRTGGSFHASRGVTRGTFHGGPFRGNYNAAVTRSFVGRSASRGSFFGGGRAVAGVSRGASAATHGFGRRR